MSSLWKPQQIQGKTGWRLFFATILCGPLAGMAVMGVIGVVYFLLTFGSDMTSSVPSAMLGAGLLGAMIGWPAMLIFGLPAHALLYRRRSHRIGGYLLAGAILGLFASAVLGLLQMVGSPIFGGAALMAGGVIALILLIASVAASSLFWWIRRPDRDVPSPDKLAATFE